MGNIRRAELLRYLVLAAQREGTQLLTARFRKLNTTTSQAEMLRVIKEHGTISVKQLGERLICEGGSPSRLVSTLTKRGLIEAMPTESDRRTLAISLTTKGQELVKQIEVEEQAFYNKIELQLDDAQGLEAQLVSFLRGTRSAQALKLRGTINIE